MRSCVLRIFEVATISIAFVIFCVLCTLAILVFISFAPAILFLRYFYHALLALKLSKIDFNDALTSSL